jgi:peptidoglycan-associated lipoprotein
VAYEDMAKAFPSDERAKQGIESSKAALAWLVAATRYQVGSVSNLNTKAHEYGLAFDGRQGSYEELLFSSTREGGVGKRKDGWTGQQFSDIYTSKRLNADGSARGGKRAKGGSKADPSAARDQKFSAPELLPEIINTMDHEGSPSFDAKRRNLYFTRCMDVKRAQLGCAIYVTRRAGQTWQEPTPVVLTKDSSRSVGHPSINSDESLLYFAGDLEGSVGGKDLWVASYDKRRRTWGNPVNLGALVNTKGDELFPFIHDDGFLYFSSEGLPGMGGYDLFRVPVGEDGLPTGEPENLKHPINSSGDDFNIILRPGGLRDGYFVSNRPGGTGGDDIWSVYEVPLKYGLRGTLKSEKDQTPLSNATVKISGSDGFTATVMTDKLGKFELIDEKFAADVTYSLAFEKKKYLNSWAKANTVGLNLDKFVFQRVKMHSATPWRLQPRWPQLNILSFCLSSTLIWPNGI